MKLPNGWPSVRPRDLIRGLNKMGFFETARTTGSHRKFSKPGHASVCFSFHDGATVGPPLLSRIAKKTGLRPEML